MSFSKWPIFRLFAARKEKQQLEVTLRRKEAEFSVERGVLIDEISRLKHMVGVHQKLFNNLGVFKNTFTMVQSSLEHLLDKATCNTKYAIVAEIEAVKVAHLMFKLDVYGRFMHSTNPCQAEDRFCSAPKQPLASYSESEFGKWYYGEGQKLASNLMFKTIDVAYRRLHICAEAAIDLFAEGLYLEGVDKVTDMEQASIEIQTSLESLAVALMETAQAECNDPTCNDTKGSLANTIKIIPEIGDTK